MSLTIKVIVPKQLVMSLLESQGPLSPLAEFIVFELFPQSVLNEFAEGFTGEELLMYLKLDHDLEGHRDDTWDDWLKHTEDCKVCKAVLHAIEVKVAAKNMPKKTMTIDEAIARLRPFLENN
ncbi:MAG: hypothetical protein ACOZAO_04315 [Patescibacteria group bacterium]